MDAYETRRTNARRLASEVGGQAKFAVKLGKSLSMVGQWIGDKPARNIGPTAARDIEEAFGKPHGWLDMPQDFQNVSPAAVGHKHVPLIDYVQAGMMSEITDPFSFGNGFESIATEIDVSDVAFALEVRGDSMTPDFREGDRIIIDPKVSPRPGDFVVAKNDDHEATFKKYRVRGIAPSGQAIFELVPLNPDYPTLRSDEQSLHVIGTLVEHRRRFRR